MFRNILRVAATFAVVFFWPRQGCAVTAETTVVGHFFGTTNAGNIGGPADGDDYTTEIEVDSENNVKTFLPKFQCGSNWQALEVIEEKYLKFTYINAFGSCLPETTVTLQHVAGTEWSYRWETDTSYGIGTLRYVCLKDCGKGNFCSSSALDEEQGLTFAEDGSIGSCFPFTAETQNAFYDEQNTSLQCPFESLAQAVDGDNQDVVLDVYLDSSEFGNTNGGVYNFDSKRDDKPTTSILRGQELVAPLEGCQTNSLAAQRQDDAVCFTYEIYETSLMNFGTPRKVGTSHHHK